VNQCGPDFLPSALERINPRRDCLPVAITRELAAMPYRELELKAQSCARMADKCSETYVKEALRELADEFQRQAQQEKQRERGN
jgi:hypothetical protein